MDKYILVNAGTGETVTLTPEQVEALTAASAEPKRADPCERGIDGAYYRISDYGSVITGKDEGLLVDEKRYDAANYCRDRDMMAQRALHETLSRLLWRYSEQHGGDTEWDGENTHWSVVTNGGPLDFSVACAHWLKEGTAYFCSEYVAWAAIKEIVKPFCEAHPEFVW